MIIIPFPSLIILFHPSSFGVLIKFLPLLAFTLNFLLFFLLFIFISFAEDYFGRIVYAGTKLLIQLLWKVPWIAILSYSGLMMCSTLLVSIKVFLTVSMIVGNIIDVYLFGMIAVLISVLLYLWFFGLIIISFLLFIFLSSLSSFLFIILLLESFTIFFQSLTLSNRLSINMLCGTLLTSLLSLFLLSSSITYAITSLILLTFLFIVFSFEILNSSIQLFIFLLLTFEYLMVFYVLRK